jgi:hypothetical protein
MKTKKCVWTSEVESSYWETDCGQGVYFTDVDGPKADGMLYCAWCGNKIKEKRVVISEEKQ